MLYGSRDIRSRTLRRNPLPAGRQGASAAGLAGRARVKRATRPDPTRPDPTRPDPTRPDPTRPDPTRPDPTRPDPNLLGQPLPPTGSRRPAPDGAQCPLPLPAAGRPLRAPLRPLAAALALLAAAAAAPAQTSVKMAGNTTVTPAPAPSRFDVAQSFDTGPNPDGYKLTRADIRLLGGSGTAPTYTVSIHKDSSNDPGDSLGTLTNPASWPSTAGLAQHDAPSAGIELAAGTTYWLVLDITGNPSQSGTEWLMYASSSDSEDRGSWVGWGIGNDSRSRAWDSTTGIWSLGGNSLLLDIHGYAIDPPLVSNAGQTSLPGVLGSTFDSAFTADRAQRFTTGSKASGYKLTDVDLFIKSSATTTPVYSVSVHSDSSTCAPTSITSCPGDSLGTLTTSATLSSSYARIQFSASGDGIGLDASTRYWLLIDVSTGDASTTLHVLTSDGEDSGGPAGWEIRDDALARNNHVSQWRAPPLTNPIRLAVWGAAVSPSVTGVAVVSAPAAGDTYGLGETIQVQLTFSEAVAVDTSSGTPRLQIKMDPAFGQKWADYASGSGTTLRFDYAVESVNRSPTGIAVLENTLELNGGTIKSTATEADAELAHAGLSHDSDHKVDGSLVPATPGPSDPGPRQPDPDPRQPGPSGGTAQARHDPRPLQLALWTDRPGYRPGETVRLYRTLDPHDDKGRYRTFAWLERSDGSERRYLAPLSAEGSLREEAVDARGLPASAEVSGFLSAADRDMAWQGPAPAPGLWQFVLELRPASGPAGAPGEDVPVGARRAWTRFVVAERSLLLNRRGFDREVRSDLTLRSDTVYHLLHQLFVHDGATLTIEPGTLVQAWGPNTAIIVERGGRIVAEGTAEAPVVLTCSAPAGWREPGCWAGLRILGRAPVTRLEGVAPGVLPAERPVYGGSDAEDSSGALRYVRVEFAGAGGDPDEAEAAGPAIGLYGAGSGTVLDHVQAHASLGDGFAFRGGTAVCDHCVASGSGGAGLSWQHGWRGGASHLYVQHGSRGYDGLAGANDEHGHDREPRSLPALSNVTLVHASPYGDRARTAVALRLSSGSGVRVREFLATGFLAGAVKADGRSALLFGEGESSLSGALLYRNGARQLRGVLGDAAEVISRDPKLRDVRDFPNPDPRPKADSPALPDEGQGYIGAFDSTKNWLEKWTVFGPESAYDLRQREEEGN